MPCKAYGQSKLANVLLARELAERWRGWPVAVAACHPGLIKTDWPRHLPSWAVNAALTLAR
jgi:NAD(P)-dependent dehydrogenase (short-subunit alcohol dehydrogenase family)